MTLTESFNEPLDQPINEDVFEFSDDPEMYYEPAQVRTRSQSKTKEASLPPAEPVKPKVRKQAKVKRASKKADPDYGPRRRRKLVEVEEEEFSEQRPLSRPLWSEISDDEK